MSKANHLKAAVPLYTYEGTSPGGTILTREDKLIQRIEQGDLSAADELVTLYYPEILRYCLWHAPDHSLAEDAAQETFLKVIRYFDRYTHKGKFKSFLYQIAANTCTDLWRKHRHSDISLEEAAVDPAYLDPSFEDIQSDLTLRQLVGGLERVAQEIVLLRFGQDLTMREIAQTLQLPLRTVQSRLRRALKKLRAEIVLSEEEPVQKERSTARKEPRHET